MDRDKLLDSKTVKIIHKRVVKLELDVDKIETIVRQYFVDHVGEDLGPNDLRWDLTGQMPVLIVDYERDLLAPEAQK